MKTLFSFGRLSLEFKKQDLWIGVFYDKHNIWACLIPTLPIHIIYKLPQVPESELWGNGWDLLPPARMLDMRIAYLKGWCDFWTDGSYLMGYAPGSLDGYYSLESERSPVPSFRKGNK